MTFQHLQLEPPKLWQDFEGLCHLLWMEILKDPNTLMHGRQGQSQSGVDIYGICANTFKRYGIQCKGKDKLYGVQVTERELRAEVAKALTFQPECPQVFILATTAPRDRNIQKVARQIIMEQRSTSRMEVYVYAWDDIVTRIALYPDVIQEFYPHLSDKNHQLRYSIDAMRTSVADIQTHLLKPSNAFLKLNNKDEVQKYFFEASNGLLNWPRTLHSNNTWIERVEEENITIQFDADLSSSSIILGDPGTGKSALLGKIAQNLTDDDEIVLAIKADQLDKCVEDFKTLGLELGLPGPIDECIKIASQFGKVFLFVDQLDTLSELVDVKTKRLSVLLNLVKLLRFEPNVHVVASSRPFEFAHDARLSSIKAQKVQLSPLTWEATEAVLKDSGVYLTSVDQDFKNFLCKPSNLNFYLDYLVNNREKNFLSHIELYEDIWKSSLGSGTARERRANFLLEVASIMTNDAKQALPVVRYEKYLHDIDFLTNAGILVKNSSNKSFSFAHQTLQAFVWTRSFIKQNSSLTNFVITYQHNLNIRPKLSTTLFYLRDAEIDEYNAQITSILSTNLTSIKRHIVHLIIECIGAHHDPNFYEVNVLKKMVYDEHYQGTVCKAISGKNLWFDNFKHDVIPALMVGSSTSKFVCTFILSSVLQDRHDEVLILVDRYWKTEENVNYIAYILRNSSYWNAKLLELAKFLVAHDNVHDYVPGMLYDILAETSATMAITLAGYYFKTKLQKLIETSPFPDSTTTPESDSFLHSGKHDARQQYEKLMDFGTGWHDLEKVVEKAPEDFIEIFWPFFLAGCENTRSSYHPDRNAYHDCSGGWFHLSDEKNEYGGKYFAEALEQSIKLTARRSKEDFLALYNINKLSDLLPVQRLLMKGLIEIVPEEPVFVLEQLVADKRRMKLGSSHEDRYTGTIEAIRMLSPHLSDEQHMQLQKYIMSCSARESDSEITAEARQYDLTYNRKVRYRLLSAIGNEYLSNALKKHMVEEERALGSNIKTWADSAFSGGFIKSVSPMNEAQLEKAKVSDIVNCFKAFPDNREDWPTGGTFISGMEFGRTFEHFAEKNPTKAIEVIKQLEIANVLAVGHGLIGISKSGIEQQDLLDLIDILEATFASLDFYDDACRALSNKFIPERPLNAEWLKRIEQWIKVKPGENTTEDDTEQEALEHEAKQENEENNGEDNINAVIWGHGNVYGIPSGNYQILAFLTVAYLLRPAPMSHEWAKMVVEYINQKDSIRVWLTFLAIKFPKAIRVCGAKDIESIIDAIIENYPEVTRGTELAFTFAECAKHVSESKLYTWLDFMRGNNSPKSRQIYGEILGLKWIFNPALDETNTRINELINACETPEIYGLAFTLENIWKYRKPLVNPLCVRLIELQKKTLTRILLGVLHDSDLSPSQELNTIIDSFIANRSIELSDNPDSFIAHCLLPLAPQEPKRVAQVCEALISTHGKNLGDISTHASFATSDMITIAITIHNMGREYQKIGLDIFEKLMDFDAYQIREALQKIDAVPQVRIRSN